VQLAARDFMGAAGSAIATAGAGEDTPVEVALEE